MNKTKKEEENEREKVPEEQTRVHNIEEANTAELWSKRKEELQDKVFWKAEEGQHQIKFLTEGDPHTSEWEGKQFNKVLFEVEVKGNRFLWDVNKGITLNSLFGQIVLVANSKGGKISGETINLAVKGSGKETKYIVLEALQLSQKSSDENIRSEGDVE